MIELKFSKPKEVYADNAYDGRRFEFAYSMKYVAPSPQKDKITQKKAIVSISDDLLRRWNFQNDNDLTKVVFYEFVFKIIQNKLIENNLLNIEKLNLTTAFVNRQIIYDPNKLSEFINILFSIDLEELKRNKNKINIGFQIHNKG
ncbi:MAG: hypothetical protein IH950_12225 [Bacteroidetes bacterium]|nr:hypothetical protein [Bacteroidota bacterium]